MRKFTILGGGQSGLQLGIGLLNAGHQERFGQNRTADDVAQGKVLSNQCMFFYAVQHERDLGIDFWSVDCPPGAGHQLHRAQPRWLWHQADRLGGASGSERLFRRSFAENPARDG